MTNPSASSEEIGGDERRATNLELFLDLVFVFAVTQIASFIAHHLTLAGAARGALITWLVWWLWSQFAWMGTAVDLDVDRSSQMAVMVAVGPAVLMGVALPEAFGDRGALFGISYLVVQLIPLVVQGVKMWPDENQRASFASYASVAWIGPAMVAIGGLVGGAFRPALWIIAATTGVVGALASGRDAASGNSHWAIAPRHFAERHSLFVIIALGEVLVAIGATATATKAGADVVAASLAATCGAVALWWIYFAYIPRVAEHALVRVDPRRRSRVARDMFTFGHFPIVFGIILYAVGAKHVVEDPAHHLARGDLTVLSAAVVVSVGGFMTLHFLYNRGVAWERPVAAAFAVAVLQLAGPHLPGGLAIATVPVVLAAMHLWTVRHLAARLAEGDRRSAPE